MTEAGPPTPAMSSRGRGHHARAAGAVTVGTPPKPVPGAARRAAPPGRAAAGAEVAEVADSESVGDVVVEQRASARWPRSSLLLCCPA